MIGGMTSLFRSASASLTKNLKALGTNLKGIGNDILAEVGAIAAPVLAVAAVTAIAGTNRQPQPA